MKICYIADGISIHTQRWVNYFAEKGHEVHVISSRFPYGYQGFDHRIRKHHLVRVVPRLWSLTGYLSGVLWLPQVRRLIKKIKPGIVDAHFIKVPGYLGTASGFHPLVLTAWGSDVLIVPKYNPIFRFLTKQALKRADLVVCMSSLMRDEIVKLGTSPSRIEICFLGVNTNEFNPAQKTDEFRQKLNIDSSALVVISTRSLKPIYNVETLIRAVPLVLEHVPDSMFIIAGEGEQRDYLKTLAQSMEVSDSIRFVGWIPHSELPSYLASSDVYVSTSLSDGTSVSLLEALSCELAPVVTDIPANRPWVNDGENGFLIPVREYEMLAEGIIRLLEDEGLRKKFGEAGRAIVIEKAEHKEQMSRVMGIYTELKSSKA